MITIQGAHNSAVCYTAALEEQAEAQIRAVCDQPAFAGSKIRVMPDVHAGMGCTIGTTMTIRDKVVPGMVGVDIGCGMETVRLARRDADLAALDAFIHAQIPCGREIRKKPHPYHEEIDLSRLYCAPHVNLERARRSIGTLGGGNHFIEAGRDEGGELYLIVHSGSRHIGNEVAKYYQEQGRLAMWGGAGYQIDELIAQLKAQGRHREIQSAVRTLKKANRLDIPADLTYVEGRLFDEYIHDMKLIQHFAALNRRAMVDVILRGMGMENAESFTTVHNYIDTEHMILRKGAVSARGGERLLIPINMRDGSLLCEGLGNEDWNCSAPHGAGRLMSRRAALGTLSMEEYRAEMAGIYTTCVVPDTLDESPMAYKSIHEILAQIGPTARIVGRIRPVYTIFL